MESSFIRSSPFASLDDFCNIYCIRFKDDRMTDKYYLRLSDVENAIKFATSFEPDNVLIVKCRRNDTVYREALKNSFFEDISKDSYSGTVNYLQWKQEKGY